jgi:hypothetical protein
MAHRCLFCYDNGKPHENVGRKTTGFIQNDMGQFTRF